MVLSDPDGSVSRLHALLHCLPGEPAPWAIQDAGSRHGTFVNAERLGEDRRPLSAGDQLRIGPWTFRVMMGDSPRTRRLAVTTDDRRFTGTYVQRLAPQTLELGAQRRLEILMRCSASMPAARTEEEMAALAQAALVEGSGFPRCAIVRLAPHDEVEVLAAGGDREVCFSRSLISAAADPENLGQSVLLNPGTQFIGPELGHSVTALNISAALCCPILVQRMPAPSPHAGFAARPPSPVTIADAFVYLDARGTDRAEMAISPETVAFCQAIARLSGLALSNLGRAQAEKESHRRQNELVAAREVQRIIMPPLLGDFACGTTDHGNGGGLGQGANLEVSYCVASIPGRLVAGDLFDIFRIDHTRVGVFLGDVVGKGVAAGMVMANVQAHLSRLLRSEKDPAPALTEVGHLVAQYSSRLSEEHGHVSLFISLFAAVLDLRERTLTYSDAGHGYQLLRPPGERPQRPFILGGAPLGVSPESVYESSTLEVAPGSRLFLFSDGLVEQQDAKGRQFGVDQVLETLRPGGSSKRSTPEDEVKALVAALRGHCDNADCFADDVTVAAVGLEMR